MIDLIIAAYLATGQVLILAQYILAKSLGVQTLNRSVLYMFVLGWPPAVLLVTVLFLLTPKGQRKGALRSWYSV